MITLWKCLKLAFYFVVDNWRAFVLTLVIIGAVVIVYLAFRPAPAKLDEREIQESIKAIEEKNDAKLKEILVNADIRERQIDANLANAKVETINAAADARKKYANMNTSDLAAEIERRK